MYAAHRKEEGSIQEGSIQALQDHLRQTAEMCEGFAASFGAEELAFIIGLCHDLGKYSEAFQKRLLHNGPKVDHATAGGLEISRLCGLLGAYCVMGHHGGLPNGGSMADTAAEPTLYGRLKRKPGKDIPDYKAYAQEIKLKRPQEPPLKPLGDKGFSCSMLIRMLFSCLVDADFLDTERFMSETPVQRGGFDDISRLRQRLLDFLATFPHPSSPINQKRNEILQNCFAKALYPQGLFTLTVPTGGGKTLSSLAFALSHAEKHHMQRVIYVIPYTSIIEQNAQVFAHILGSENVLEHHAGFDYENDNDQRHYLATENWDIPVVVTTNVQFFESLFAAKTSKCRKNHNIAHSVIVFDEAQMLPIPYLLPCVRALAELVHNFKSTVVLCSATQPTLDHFIPPDITCTEITDNPQDLYSFFKRVEIRPLGVCTDEQLAERLQTHEQVLCIVNTRRHAQNIFFLLDREGCFHLSALMYPEHRKKVLEQIRRRLQAGQTCRVVATNLIEAGVDVDFPVVYRASAGLDAIIQAAGRCNREGKRPKEESFVYVFEPEAGYTPPVYVRQPMEVGAIIAEKHAEDMATPEAIRDYFASLYTLKGEQLDTKSIVSRLEQGYQNGGSFPFKTVAEEFRLIEDNTRAVLIPHTPESKAYAQRLRNGERGRALLRSVGRHCVTVYDRHFNALREVGMLECLDTEIAVLTDITGYSDETGLTLKPEGGNALFVEW